MDAAENQHDPFESVIKLCLPIDSQEEKFPNCPFARASESIMESNPDHFSSSPEQTPSEIVMVSAPGSSSTADQRMPGEDAVFHTPPEHHSHLHLSSSEDQNPTELCAEGVRIADTTTKVRVSEAGLDDEPEPKRARVVPGEEFEGEADEVIALGSGDCNGEDADAVNGNHELGGKIECSKGIGVTDSSRSLDSGKTERECDGAAVPLGETELDETEVVEVIALSSGNSNGEERAEGSLGEVGGLMKDAVAINELGEKIEYATGIGVTRCEKSDSRGETERDVAKLNHSFKRIEEFRYSAKGCDGRRERQLPPSLKEKDKNVVEGPAKMSNQGLLDLMDMLSAVFKDTDCGSEDEDEEVDFIETAKRKGMKFPRPRWWPPPGEDF